MKKFLNAENVTALVIVVIGVIIAGYVGSYLRKRAAASTTTTGS
jgi:uncharacterized membrane protein SpoIIM required for sporulation